MIKRILFFLEPFFPSLVQYVIEKLRIVRFYFFRIRFWLFSIAKENIFKFDKIIFIDPQKVVNCPIHINLEKDRGVIKDGDWDLNTKLFSDLDTYRAMHDHFVEKKAWKDTDYYHKYASKIAQNERYWGCSNIDEWDTYLKNIDLLYKDIKENGYKLNNDPSGVEVYSNREDKLRRTLDEVSVSISRDGEFLFNDGAHRLAIAQILKLPTIPVLVIARHKQWADFVKKIRLFAKDLSRGRLYQIAFHPDTVDIPYSYSCERWPAISQHISSHNKTAIDIGANFGYLCYLMERDFGIKGVAYEINPHEANIAEKLRISMGGNYSVVRENIFNLNDQKVINYDTVLALNIFHHFIKRPHEHQQLVHLLNKLNCKEIFFETHNPDENQMIGAYRNYSPDKFADFVMTHAGLNSYTQIGEFENQRTLYHIF